jgi:hypothetical protein
MARITRTSAAVKNRYNEKSYDRISLFVPKGRKDVIVSHALTHDSSTNAFINRAIEETMQRDKGKKDDA